MGTLDREIETYNNMRPTLERDYLDKWVVIHGSELVGAYESFHIAATEAFERRKIRPCLIRRVDPNRELKVPTIVQFLPVPV